MDVPHSGKGYTSAHNKDPHISFAWAPTLKSDSVIPSFAAGGGPSRGPGRCVSGSPGADLVKEEAVSEV